MINRVFQQLNSNEFTENFIRSSRMKIVTIKTEERFVFEIQLLCHEQTLAVVFTIHLKWVFESISVLGRIERIASRGRVHDPIQHPRMFI